jgi:hypothetical protein
MEQQGSGPKFRSAVVLIILAAYTAAELGCSILPGILAPTPSQNPDTPPFTLLPPEPARSTPGGAEIVRPGSPAAPTATQVFLPNYRDLQGFDLAIDWRGTYKLDNMTAVYGPNTVAVVMNRKSTTTYDWKYEGKYGTTFDGSVTGFCNAAITWPVLFDITAYKNDAFGELNFTVVTTMGTPQTVGSCQGLEGPPRAGNIVVPIHTFKLAAEEGAECELPPEGAYTWRYKILHKR